MWKAILLLAFLCGASAKDYTVAWNGTLESMELIEGEQDIFESVAKLSFDDKTLTEGWAYLEIETFDFSNKIQSYALGFAEGAATKHLIYNAWRNTMEGYCESRAAFCSKLREYLSNNRQYMDSYIDFGSISAYWQEVSNILTQLDGMVDGYNKYSHHNISYEDFLLTSLMGDLEDLETAYGYKSNDLTRGGGRCSALIKLLPENEDLLVSHVTWNVYQAMIRIQKKYTLKLRGPTYPGSKSRRGRIIPGHTMSFSSYPGMIGSGDDFYLISSGLSTIETTIGNSNPKLWSQLTYRTVFEWIRVMVANRLAENGEIWSKVFSEFNSGTYNNQWMVVDYKLFEAGKPIKPGTLWITEQIPGNIKDGDQSDILRSTSYWASYNVPFYKEIFDLSGLPAYVHKYGDWFSYSKTPRANIFRRDHSKVKDMDSLIKLMRYNDFTNDPLSACNCTPPYSAENAISARSELNPSDGVYPFSALGHRNHGGTDVKASSSELFKDLEFVAINGPTSDQQPTFIWSDQDFNDTTPHYGHPNEFDFSLVHHKWGMSSIFE